MAPISVAAAGSGRAVFVINASDNALLAEALHEEMKQIKDQPVRYIVLENGQNHAMLGTDDWQQQGAIVKYRHLDTFD